MGEAKCGITDVLLGATNDAAILPAMMTRNVWTVVLGVLLAACANAPEDDDASLGQMGTLDGGINPPPPPQGDMRFVPPTNDMFVPPPQNDRNMPPPPPRDGGIVRMDQNMPPPPGDPLAATVVITEQPQADSSSINALVTRVQEIADAPGCQVVNVDPNAMPPAEPSFDAGNITVNGPNGGPYTLTHTPGGQYSAPNTPSDLFNDGTMFSVSAAGGANVGAFQVSLAAPAQVRLSQPPEFSFEPHPSNRDLPIVWTGGQSEVFVITVFPVNSQFDLTPRAGNWVICAVPDSGNTTVPGAQLSQIGGGQVLVTVTRTRISSTSVAQHEAFLTASTTTGALVSLQ